MHIYNHTKKLMQRSKGKEIKAMAISTGGAGIQVLVGAILNANNKAN